MKREILFRGQKAAVEEYVCGSLIIDESGGLHAMAQITEKPVNKGVIEGWCYGVLPETVGQFTGLRDKNRTKIFEGDRVRYNHHNGYNMNSFESIVFYDSKKAAFAIEGFPRNVYFTEFDELQEDFLNHLEVVE